MQTHIIEASYPLTFHQKEAKILGEFIKNKHSVVLIGMKRVGISNFLRFFLYHQDIASTYIVDGKGHLFIPVDLNDLTEREIAPFWMLTHKRIVDSVGMSLLPEKVKKEIEALFLSSIQSQDLFLTIDSVRKSLLLIIAQGVRPTLFFILFDRMKDAITQEFFANLQGMRDATHQELSYVLTSFRSLDVVSPDVFTRSATSVYYHNMYIRPVEKSDMQSIYKTYIDRYKLSLAKDVEEELFRLVDGYVRFMDLSLIILNEAKERLPQSARELSTLLHADERITIQSEELWESFTPDEQTVLGKIGKGQPVSKEEKDNARYLWDTGVITIEEEKETMFSPLFLFYLKQRGQQVINHGTDFTKKEHVLYNFLLAHTDEVCEREHIVEIVWPEEEELGVSDWAIDRLIARVRSKLKQQEAPYEIQTVKTRGYKLVNNG